MASGTVANQTPVSMGFPRQEYWRGLPFPPPGDLPDPGSKLLSLASSVRQVDSLQLHHLVTPNILPHNVVVIYGIPTPEKVIQSDIQETDIQLM